MFIIE